MNAIRIALDGVTLSAAGFEFGPIDLVSAAVSDADVDGVTYAGISTFNVYVEPA
jgi:hypothetical protein